MTRPVAVVTGAAHGIGLETARRLSATHRVALLDLDAEGVERAAAGLGDAMWAACDITDPDSVASAIEEVVAECGGIDVCISNAGIAAAGALRHLDPDVLAALVNVNLMGNWRVIHACLPHVDGAPRLRARRRLAWRRSSRRWASAPTAPPRPGSSSCSTSCASRSATSASTSAWPTSRGSTPTWCAAPRRQHPGFAAMRKGLRGPAGKTLPVGDAADAIVRGVQRRSRRVVAPGLRGRAVPPARAAPRADRSRGGQVRPRRRPLHRRDGGRARRLRRRPAPGAAGQRGRCSLRRALRNHRLGALVRTSSGIKPRPGADR